MPSLSIHFGSSRIQTADSRTAPIVYHDGYIYTGFWKSETGDASFVCVSATDEDPDVGNETKYASWRYVSKGGFYWAGAYVCDEFVLIDTGDGEAATPTATQG